MVTDFLICAPFMPCVTKCALGSWEERAGTGLTLVRERLLTLRGLWCYLLVDERSLESKSRRKTWFVSEGFKVGPCGSGKLRDRGWEDGGGWHSSPTSFCFPLFLSIINSIS